jgi:hypothetical protein
MWHSSWLCKLIEINQLNASIFNDHERHSAPTFIGEYNGVAWAPEDNNSWRGWRLAESIWFERINNEFPSVAVCPGSQPGLCNVDVRWLNVLRLESGETVQGNRHYWWTLHLKRPVICTTHIASSQTYGRAQASYGNTVPWHVNDNRFSQCCLLLER